MGTMIITHTQVIEMIVEEKNVVREKNFLNVMMMMKNDQYVVREKDFLSVIMMMAEGEVPRSSVMLTSHLHLTHVPRYLAYQSCSHLTYTSLMYLGTSFISHPHISLTPHSYT